MGGFAAGCRVFVFLATAPNTNKKDIAAALSATTGGVRRLYDRINIGPRRSETDGPVFCRSRGEGRSRPTRRTCRPDGMGKGQGADGAGVPAAMNRLARRWLRKNQGAQGGGKGEDDGKKIAVRSRRRNFRPGESQLYADPHEEVGAMITSFALAGGKKAADCRRFGFQLKKITDEFVALGDQSCQATGLGPGGENTRGLTGSFGN